MNFWCGESCTQLSRALKWVSELCVRHAGVCDVLDSRIFKLNANLQIQSICGVYVFQPNDLGIIGKYIRR